MPALTALESLLERMNEGTDFPALSHNISELNQIVGDEFAHSSALTEIILRDVALTNKLLRLVNAAHYGSFSGQPISTVSRAIVILGFNVVRDTAISLLLFEHLDNHAQADTLKTEAVESYFCGVLGRMLAGSAGIRDREEAFIVALLRNLGRLMARFHFFDETEHASRLMQDDGLSEDAATRIALGVSYDQLGLAIVRHWHFPAQVLQALSPQEPGPLRAPANVAGRLQVVANLARELHHTYVQDLPPDQQRQAINAMCGRYKAAADVSPESLAETVYKAAETVHDEARILQVDPRRSPMLKRLLKDEAGPDVTVDAEGEGSMMEGAQKTEAEGPDATAILTQGMQDLTSLILGHYQIADVLKMVAELFYRSGSFDHVVISTLDRPTQCLLGRIALGQKAEDFRRDFRIPLAFAPDVFHAALSQGQDILITDATADNIRSRIPAWHAKSSNAHAFMLLPISLSGKPVAMLYADRQNEDLQLPHQVLSLLKALRNQATLAIRQKI
jgi:HD-like signal output (HDOD) protein